MRYQSPAIKFNVAEPSKIGNLAERLKASDRRVLGEHILELVRLDEQSMGEWQGNARAYLDNFRDGKNKDEPQNREQKGSNEPAFAPGTGLTTSAVIQFTARATKAILSEPDLAHASEPGAEPLAAWLSTQLRSVDKAWVTDTDPLIMHMAVTGLSWRKRWYDEHAKEFRSTFLTVDEVIINRGAKSIDRVPRITHKFEKYPYEIERSIALGHWVDYNPDFNTEDPQELKLFYEVDMWVDMDGDGIDEPWIVTVADDNVPEVIKMLPRWSEKTVIVNNDDIAFNPFVRYYAYKMIPDPDGGFFPFGFGWLLDQPESSANRMLASIDDVAKSNAENGGVYASSGMGLTEHIELKSNRVTAIPTDGRPISEVFSAFPQKQVTPAMFQTLDKLITLGDRLAGTLNMLENAPASMSATLARGIIDSGSEVSGAVFRRIIFAVTSELRSFGMMAWAYDALPPEIGQRSVGYVAVSADPNMVTEMHRAAMASLYQSMLQMPLIFNVREVALRFLQTMRLPDPEKLIAPPLPPPVPPPPISLADAADLQLQFEKERTSRQRANTEAAVKLSEILVNLSKVEQDAAGIQQREQQMKQLQKIIEGLQNDREVSKPAISGSTETGEPGGSGGVAQPPRDASIPQRPAMPSGAFSGGHMGRPLSPARPAPARPGPIVPPIAPPAGTAPWIAPQFPASPDQQILGDQQNVPL